MLKNYNQIFPLRKEVINQIAAGEVIESPASVIKELIENSIDAQSTQISVYVRGGGKTFLCVEDNGIGICNSDLKIAIKQHTTSKIQNITDISKIISYGFRGEALSSICSISNFVISSKSITDNFGLELILNKGNIIDERFVEMRNGTRIEVSNLFNHFPARRKYLKSNSIESAKILRIIKIYSLIYLDIHFNVYKDNKLWLESAKKDTFLMRLNQVWNNKFDKTNLLKINVESNLFILNGYISIPSMTKSSKDDMLFFVNKRPIFNKMLFKVMKDAYKPYIAYNKYPIVFLSFHISPELIDINIHPSKLEIRFFHENVIKSILLKEISNKLKNFCNTEKKNIDPSLKELVSFSNKNELLYFEFPKDSDYDISLKNYNKTNNELKYDNWHFLQALPNKDALFMSASGIYILNYIGSSQRIMHEQLMMDMTLNNLKLKTIENPVILEVMNKNDFMINKIFFLLKENSFKVKKKNFNMIYFYNIPIYYRSADKFSKFCNYIFNDYLSPSSNADVIKKNKFQQELALDICLHYINKRNLKTNIPQSCYEEIIQKLTYCKVPNLCPRGFYTYHEVSFKNLYKKFGR